MSQANGSSMKLRAWQGWKWGKDSAPPQQGFMDHASIGTMPASQKWQDVVSLISNGADVAKVADVTLTAAQKAFFWRRVQERRWTNGESQSEAIH